MTWLIVDIVEILNRHKWKLKLGWFCFYQSFSKYLKCILFLLNTGCSNAGFYGSNCDIPCPTNCKDNTCHIKNGTCFLCKPGWNGMNCTTSMMIKSILSRFKFSFLFRSPVIVFVRHCTSCFIGQEDQSIGRANMNV